VIVRHMLDGEGPGTPQGNRDGRIIAVRFAEQRDIDLRDVGAEEEGDGPVQNDPQPAIPARHLEQVVRAPDPPRDEAREMQPEDLDDGARTAYDATASERIGAASDDWCSTRGVSRTECPNGSVIRNAEQDSSVSASRGRTV